MEKPIIWWNGAIAPFEIESTRVSYGVTMGATISDYCRTFRHEIYRWEDHLKRFRESCEAVYIKLPYSDKEISEAAQRVVRHNAALCDANQELALITLATPGPVGDGLELGAPTLGINTFPLPYARYRGVFPNGARLVTPPTRQIPASCIPSHIKHRSRLHYFLASEQAHQIERGADALLLDLDGNITETAFANFILVKDGAVLSPPASTILPGISLAVVRELCAELRIPFVERVLTLSDCTSDDEALLTGTAFCLAGVRSINGKPMRWPGPIFEKLLAAWSAQVGVDIRSQFA